MPDLFELANSPVLKVALCVALASFVIGLLFEGGQPESRADELFRWSYSDSEWSQMLRPGMRRAGVQVLAAAASFGLASFLGSLVIGQKEYRGAFLPIAASVWLIAATVVLLPPLRLWRFQWREVRIFPNAVRVGRRELLWDAENRRLHSVLLDPKSSLVRIVTVPAGRTGSSAHQSRELRLFVPLGRQSEVFEFFRRLSSASGPHSPDGALARPMFSKQRER